MPSSCCNRFTCCKNSFEIEYRDNDFIRLNNDEFSQCPKKSIDYAVMEKLATGNDEKLAVLPVNIGWSDVGAWPSVWKIKNKDNNNNYIEGDVTFRSVVR